jgi:hypothetical protein
LHKITQIISEEKLQSKRKNFYYRTTAIVDGNEVVGYADIPNAYKLGDEVESFFDDKWHVAKMQLPKPPQAHP